LKDWLVSSSTCSPTTPGPRRASSSGRTFGPDGFGVETNQFQELFISDMNRAARAAGVVLPTYGLNNTGADDAGRRPGGGRSDFADVIQVRAAGRATGRRG
jgi:hypothetical protein